MSQLSGYSGSSSSCLCFVPDTCRTAARCHWEAAGTLLPAHHCKSQPGAQFLKGLSTSECTSAATKGSSHHFLQWVIAVEYSHSSTFFMCWVLHLSVSSFWIYGFPLDEKIFQSFSTVAKQFFSFGCVK